MKLKNVAKYCGSVVTITAMTVVLLIVGVLWAVYSPWIQEQARQAIVERFSDGNPTISMSRLALRFPLRLEVDDLAIVNEGDTMVFAERLTANVAVTPLMKKRVVLDDAVLLRGGYNMGNADEALCLKLKADSLRLSPASVDLADMIIDIDNGLISRADMRLDMMPDTTAADTTKSEPTKMTINVHHIDLDRFNFVMTMLPTIDTLSVNLPTGSLNEGVIDLYEQQIKLNSVTGKELFARYLAPDSATAASVPQVESTKSDSKPWTIEIDSIGFSQSKGAYMVRGAKALPGLCFDYISVDSLTLSATNFYNCSNVVRMPLTVSGKERCGVQLDASGVLDIDSVMMRFNDFKVTTATTDLAVSGKMGMGDMTTDNSVPIALVASGGVGVEDLRMMFPTFTPYLVTLPAKDQIKIDTDLDGTIGTINLNNLDLTINKCVSMHADGIISNAMSPNKLEGKIAMTGRVENFGPLKPIVFDNATAKQVNIPQLTMNGNVAMRNGIIDGKITAHTGAGRLALDGQWNSRRDDYDASIDCTDFPVNAFMPLLGIGQVSASANVVGHGYDVFAASTEIDAHLDVDKAVYNGYAYGQISGDLSLSDGEAAVNLDCTNPDALFTLDAVGNLAGDTYEWTAQLDGRNIDLRALRFAEEEATVAVSMSASATLTPKSNDLVAEMAVSKLDFTQEIGTISISDVDAQLTATDSTTTVILNNHDLYANFDAGCGLDTLMSRFDKAMAIVNSQVKAKSINVDTLQRTLPEFALNLRAGDNNLLNDVLSNSRMSFNNLRVQLTNDSTMNMTSRLLAFRTGDIQLDTISVNLSQHDEHMHYMAAVNNRRGTLDEWAHVNLDGYLAYNQLGAKLTQHDINNRKGFDVGFKAVLVDSIATLNITPFDPTIGYQQWTVNDDNYINYDLNDGHIDANLFMSGGDSKLQVYTEHDAENHTQEDLLIKISDIHISDWIAINPFAPPMKGDLNADMRLNKQGDDVTGSGTLSLDNFSYGNEKVASFLADFDITTDLGGKLRATADLYVDSVKTMTVSGNLNEDNPLSPMSLDFSMIRFPLTTVNPFLPSGTAKLSGVLNGSMAITGTSDNPKFSGSINFEDAAVKLALTGTSYKFSDTPVAVENSVVKFSDFAISGVNENPLKVNGTVDVTDMASPKFNLALNANNMQLVNTNRAAKGADVYGKAFISLDATARGNMSFMQVDAKLDILPQTNVTYVMSDASTVLTSQSNSDMVKFVSFTDSIATPANAKTETSMAIMVDAMLNIRSGSIINVDLSTDGKSKAQLQSSGSLAYQLSPLSDEGRLTGRLTIDNGYVKYTPPYMSEKLFTFEQGSYVAFTGDMMNPTLNVKAVDEVKSNVTLSDESTRSVTFDVSLDVTGTLSSMNVTFDLSTDDDITVANEIAAMSAEQRANQAMNLLLYNVYTGATTKTSTNLTGNLFSFLESQINSWAASTIKGVDISFGIDQYKSTSDGQTSSSMSYSYQVSKSLFNDRFIIVVGGNYSTDANADENFSQNLINDISFEYFLNSSRTMYVKLFRHTGYESILEGEVTQTGVGFVYKRKLKRISDMFRFVGRVRNRLTDKSVDTANGIDSQPSETESDTEQ